MSDKKKKDDETKGLASTKIDDDLKNKSDKDTTTVKETDTDTLSDPIDSAAKGKIDVQVKSTGDNKISLEKIDESITKLAAFEAKNAADKIIKSGITSGTIAGTNIDWGKTESSGNTSRYLVVDKFPTIVKPVIVSSSSGFKVDLGSVNTNEIVDVETGKTFDWIQDSYKLGEN